ncbi:hypothetical protein ACFW6C_33095 [Streptomyces fungicidicus]|uniref:hypothetical protein n=1 Tax=Streptomyces fungicidicus TaxID=68203 RepID=UPI00369B1647
MTTNAETPRGQTGAFPKDQQGGGSEDRVEQEQPSSDAADILTELWAEAKIAYLARTFPKYGSPAWIALAPHDPRRLAAALYAAEMWRKYGDEEELLRWFREAHRSRPPLADGLSRAELDQRAKPLPAHQLQATPGWPPVQVPGKPGQYLTYTEGRAAA